MMARNIELLAWAVQRFGAGAESKATDALLTCAAAHYGFDWPRVKKEYTIEHLDRYLVTGLHRISELKPKAKWIVLVDL